VIRLLALLVLWAAAGVALAVAWTAVTAHPAGQPALVATALTAGTATAWANRPRSTTR
jgi:hypothetical protein